MLRVLRTVPLVVCALAACAPAAPQGPGIYRINASDTAEVQFRMLDSVNALRRGVGAPPVALNAALTAAANTHANDMSRQQRAWPFGTDGSSPYDRVRRAGYGGELLTEIYSQSFETELETLAAWVEDGAWGDEILDPDARDMGFGWHQDRSGLIWWAITMGAGGISGEDL